MRRFALASFIAFAAAACSWVDPEASVTSDLGNRTGTSTSSSSSGGNREWTPFREVAMVGNTPPCSEGNYTRIDNCYNEMNPPKPALDRGLTEVLRDDPNVVASPPRWGGEGADTSEHAGKTQIFPFARQTLDGRLTLQGGCKGCPYRPAFAALRPEALSYDFKVKPQESAQPRHLSGVHPVMLWDPVHSTLASQQGNHDLYEPDALHNTICEDQSKHNPHRCRARQNGVQRQGDCYEVTLLFGARGGDGGESAEPNPEKRKQQWELRSSDLTVFVPDAKTTAAGENTNETFVYPHFDEPPVDAAGVWDLGADADYSLPMSWEAFSKPGQSYASLLKNPADSRWGCFTQSGARNPAAPKWCAYYFGQHHLATFNIDDNGNDNINDGVTTCVGERAGCRNYALFELSVTGDGRLLVLNLNDKGIFYSYNTGTPCHADGFSRLRPLSFLPVDPLLQNTNYGIVRSTKGRPFTTSMGERLLPGRLGNGAYPWISASGAVLAWSQVNQGRDGYYARRSSGFVGAAGNATEIDREYGFLDEPKPSLNPDLGGAGKGVTVLGSWTQGKMVVLDNGANVTDFARAVLGAKVNGQDVRYDEFDLQLYSFEGPRRLRTKGAPTINSWENKYNHFDALSPTLPFDVVWGFSTSNQHNSEVAFDRYMMQNALVVAHMNAPIDTARFGVEMYRDGFVPDHPHQRVRDGGSPAFHYAETPLLQNASTASGALAAPGEWYVEPPKVLALRGGARVEPVALGGVLGKGVYLDGDNDFIDVTIPEQPAPLSEAYLGVWLNPRVLDIAKQNMLYRFSDGSWIGLEFRHFDAESVGYLGVAYDARADRRSEVVLSRGSAPTLFGRGWRHVGVALRHRNAGYAHKRSLDFYLSGTYAATLEFDEPSEVPAFPLAGQLTVGGLPHKPIGTQRNFQGWLDELTILAYRPGELRPPQEASPQRELFCNEALGTMVDVTERLDEPRLPALEVLRRRYAELPYVATRVCENMALSSTALPLDFAPQRDTGLCVDRFHRTPRSVGGERCIRSALLGTGAVLPMDTAAPRPSFAGNAFCLTCHREGAQVQGLRPAALEAGAAGVPRHLDARRQPLDWPARMYGVQPVWASGLAPSQAGWLDFLFDQGPKLAP